MSQDGALPHSANPHGSRIACSIVRSSLHRASGRPRMKPDVACPARGASPPSHIAQSPPRPPRANQITRGRRTFTTRIVRRYRRRPFRAAARTRRALLPAFRLRDRGRRRGVRVGGRAARPGFTAVDVRGGDRRRTPGDSVEGVAGGRQVVGRGCRPSSAIGWPAAPPAAGAQARRVPCSAPGSVLRPTSLGTRGRRTPGSHVTTTRRQVVT